MNKVLLTMALLLITTGCKTVYRDVPVDVLVPVPQPCMTKVPEEVKPLKDTMTLKEWKKNDLKQKIAKASANSGKLRNYAGDLKVASAGCPEIKE